jgi:hypothetical protein
MFNYFEDRFTVIYDKLLKEIHETHQIEENILYGLCEFVAVSRLRGKSFRDLMLKSSQDLMKELMISNYRMIKIHNPNNEMVKKISSDKELENIILN